MANTPEAEEQEKQLGEPQLEKEIEEEIEPYVPPRGFIGHNLKTSGKMMIFTFHQINSYQELFKR